MCEPLFRYHDRTKHHPHRYARGPGFLDWANEPYPFRLYEGAPRIALRIREPETKERPFYDELYREPLRPEPVSRESLSELFYNSFALSAWKRIPGSEWSLRCNPSSGDLHPTEVYLLTPPVPGISETPALFHYDVYHHALELRAHYPPELWERFLGGLPGGSLLVGFTSIFWREAWKYGERALRYCLLDLGHALAALQYGADCLGWRAALLPVVEPKKLAHLLGISGQEGVEAEHPDLLVALFPEGAIAWEAVSRWKLSEETARAMAAHLRPDRPNRLSRDHVRWSIIDETAAAMATERISVSPPSGRLGPPPFPVRPLSARWLIRRRRSAVQMDGKTAMAQDDFERLLWRLLDAGNLPHLALGSRPRVHPVFYIHRLEGLAPGLYFLPRSGAGERLFRERTEGRWLWEPPFDRKLPFYLLAEGEVQRIAAAVSCHQEIAADGAFALSLVAEFERPIRENRWEYARLHLEAGALGQLLYLEAESCGLQGTGIGCFFDDTIHELLGLSDHALQVVYHFTVGKGVEDSRIQKLPAYHHLKTGSSIPLSREEKL